MFCVHCIPSAELPYLMLLANRSSRSRCKKRKSEETEDVGGEPNENKEDENNGEGRISRSATVKETRRKRTGREFSSSRRISRPFGRKADQEWLRRRTRRDRKMRFSTSRVRGPGNRTPGRSPSRNSFDRPSSLDRKSGLCIEASNRSVRRA